MKTYFAVCGIVLHGLVLLTMLGMIISEINARKNNKKKASEKAQKQIRYKEELKAAEQAWQQLAKKIDELNQRHEQETDLTERLRIEIAFLVYKCERYYFASMDRYDNLYNLGKQNNWFRKGIGGHQ